MRWLFLKDLTILRRSPLLVALLVLYPIVISVLMGLALSAGPDKPSVAVLNQIPPSGNSISLGGQDLDVSKYSTQLYSRVDPVKVSTREEAIEKVESGQVLAALIIPADVTSKLEAGLEPATVEVYYNAEDPVKAAFVQDVIKSQVADANLALTQRFTAAALEYINLIGTGGTLLRPRADAEHPGPREVGADPQRGGGRPVRGRQGPGRAGGELRQARAGEPDARQRGARVGGRSHPGRDARGQGRLDAAHVLRHRHRGDRLAHVRHAAARLGDARARAGGGRVRTAGPRPRLADRAARGEGPPGGGLRAAREPADARRPRAVHRPGSRRAPRRG